MNKIVFQSAQSGQSYDQYWKKLATAGRASEGLREEWRVQLKEVQQNIQFEYIRFHGIFHDDMMVYHETPEGIPYYNWQYVDELFDFLLSVQIRPFVEFGFMPSRLASGEQTCFWWKGNVTPPKDYQKWCQLIRAFILHSINRYGLEEVLKWYFEVWNEPDNPYFWSSTQQEYFKLYTLTAQTIKNIHPNLKVGGPATTNFQNGEGRWIKDFLKHCIHQKAPVDFISTHPYPNDWPIGPDGNEMMVYREPDAVLNDLTWLRNTVNGSKLPHLEIHLTEWNCSALSRDLCRDTAFMAPFIIKSNIECTGLVNSLGFWTFTDIFEEQGAGDTIFHGGFGMITQQGLKKPAYHGYWFLSRLGNECVLKNKNYAVFRKGPDTLQILMWNYCHYKKGFANADRSEMNYWERYNVFLDTGVSTFHIHVEGIKGRYRILEHTFDRENGSVFDEWIDSGAPQEPTREEINILKRRMDINSRTYEIFSEKAYESECIVKPHGVKLIELVKIYE